MDSARWEQIQALFHKALEHPESERQAFLEAAGNDGDLIAEVLSMLNADSRNASLLDRGLPEVAYRMVGSPLDSLPLQEFGPYRLKRILGEGGMGVVWLAERKDAGNLVAIKFLPHAGLSPARRERFAREIKTLAKLKHPFIARLYDAGTLADGTPWFVMEYVEGERFTEYCRKPERSLGERLRLFRMVCEAVQHAHGQEIIHRDLKPSNILVERDGTPRLLDFGIARELHILDETADRTRPGLRFLSPDYAAPEWAGDGIVGFYTDVYWLGVILYETLTGQLPTKREDATKAVEKPSVTGKRALSLTKAAWDDLDVLCLKAMNANPRERYQSVEALIRDIDHYLKGEPLEAQPDTVRYRLGKFVTRNKRAVLATSLACALLVGLVVFFTVRLAKERDHANHETEIATAMNRFLSDDLLGQSDPFKSGKAQESFADVVSRASSRIDVQFRAEPVAAARLHLAIATALDARSSYHPARQEYERANDLFREAEGPESQDAVLVRLLEVGEEARSYEPGSLELAKSLLKGAELVLSGKAHPREDLEAWRLSARGVIAITENDPRSAIADFSAALRCAQAIPTFNEIHLQRIKERLAFCYMRLPNGAKAEELFRQLLRESARTNGKDSLETLRLRAFLSQSLLVQGKYGEDIREADAIYPVLAEKLGEDHEFAVGVLGTRAAAEGHLGLWDRAVRDDLAIYKLAVRKQGQASFFSLATLSDAGLSQCRAGHYADGEANTRKAFEQSSQRFKQAALTEAISYALAYCLVGENKLIEASARLDGIDVQAVTHLTGESTVAGDIALAQGEIALRRGNFELARRDAQVVSQAFERSKADEFDKQELVSLEKAIESRRK